MDCQNVQQQGKGQPLPCCHSRERRRLVVVAGTVRRGNKVVLRQVDFEVAAGEFVAVVGPNGSGKSTLLLLLKGALHPETGHVVAGGEPLLPFDSRVGLVLANPEDQGIAPVVEDDVAFGLECRGLPAEEVRLRVREALRAVGLEELRSASTHTLSGGQGQKLALAAVLALGAQWLLLDEATSMLSSWDRDALLTTVARLKGMGLGVVQVTHQSEELLWADRVVVLGDGVVAFDGPPADYFAWTGRALPVPEFETLRRLVADHGAGMPPFPAWVAWLSR